MTGTEQRFEFEAILDKKIINGKEKFKVKWKGFSLDDCTWEPREHFEDSNAYLIDEYYAKISGKNTQEHSKDEESHPKKTPSSHSSKKIEEKELFTRKKRNLPKKDKFQVKKVIKDSSYSDNDSDSDYEEEKKETHRDTRKKGKQNVEGVLGKDSPLMIISVKTHAALPRELLCEIEWKTREDGIKPKNSFYKNDAIKKEEPVLLVEYYEKHLCFPERKQK